VQCLLQTPAYHHDSVDVAVAVAVAVAVVVADVVVELGYGQNVDHRLPGTDVA
jgi:hypothetical protein